MPYHGAHGTNDSSGRYANENTIPFAGACWVGTFFCWNSVICDDGFGAVFGQSSCRSYIHRSVLAVWFGHRTGRIRLYSIGPADDCSENGHGGHMAGVDSDREYLFDVECGEEA